MDAITMSSTAYEVAVRPSVENRELPAPTGRRNVGRGSQHTWPMDRDLLTELWWRCVDFYACSGGWDDEDAAKDRAAIKAWLDRYRPVMEPSPQAG